MTLTHEATPVPDATPEPKPKRGKKATPATTETPASEPTPESSIEQPAPEPTKRAKPKKVAKGPCPEMPLAELGAHYITHLEATKSAGTALSYKMEIDRAVAFLGADTPIHCITRDDVERFNASDLVMRKRDGTPKAQPSFLKTQRVLRLALTWAAHDRKWIEWVPFADVEPK
jgi:hypothetical protein